MIILQNIALKLDEKQESSNIGIRLLSDPFS